jgi:hypothetical protein
MIKQPNDGYLLTGAKEELTRRYPYLKIEFPAIRKAILRVETGEAGQTGLKSENITTDEWMNNVLCISDTMTVRDLEQRIEFHFNTPVLVFRNSGKFWIETRMTRDWTLKQQNDHGRDLAAGSK